MYAPSALGGAAVVRTVLTATHVKRAVEAAEDGQVSDARVTGLVLQTRRGKASLIVKTKAKTLHLGPADDISLKLAREMTESVRRLWDQGLDPAPYVRARRAGATEAAALAQVEGKGDGWTLQQVFDLKRADAKKAKVRRSTKLLTAPSPATLRDIEMCLGYEAWTPLLQRQVSTLGRADLERVRDAIAKRHKPASAKKAMSYAKAALSLAARDYAECGISQDAPWWRQVHVEHESPDRTRMLSLPQARALWRLLEEDDGISWRVRLGLQWLLLTGQRRGSGLGLRRESLVLDSEISGYPGWGLAAWSQDETKGRRPIALPLPPVAVAVLTEALRLGDPDSPWVFPSSKDPSAPVTESIINTRLRRTLAPRLKAAGVPPFSPHDLRRTIGTWLRSQRDAPTLGVAAGMILDHSAGPAANGDAAAMQVAQITGRYDLSGALGLKAAALEAWSEALTA